MDFEAQCRFAVVVDDAVSCLVCLPPLEPENGGYSCHPAPCRRLTQGTVIEYVCDEGFILKGDYKYLTCQDAQWELPMQISCVSQGVSPSSGYNIPVRSHS